MWRKSSTTILNKNRHGWFILFMLIVAWSCGQSGLFRQELINHGGWSLVSRFFGAALSPELSPDFLWLTLEATLTTLAYAISGACLSLLIGSSLALPSSRLFWQAMGAERAWFPMRGLLALPRAIHELLWGLFFVNIFGLNPLTAIFAIAVPYSAIVAKIFSEILDDTPRQPYTILTNSGVTPLPAVLYGLLPQAMPDMLSYAFYRLECAIRAAAVLGVIGAGGLGYQILLSLQSLRYHELWTLFYALILLTGLVDVWSGLVRRRLQTLSTSHRRAGIVSDSLLRGSSGLIFLLIPFSFWYINPNWSILWSPRTYRLLMDILSAAFPPRIENVTTMLALSGQTLAMSILAAIIASFGGLALALPAANRIVLPGGLLNPHQRGASWSIGGWLMLLLSRLILLTARAIPAPIWALVMLFIFFPGILPGAIALGIYNMGIIGRLMAEVIENMDDRPLKALRTQGVSGGHIFFYGVLPLIWPRFIGFSLYRWEICIRATVIVGLVGAGGLGRLLTEQLSSFDYAGVSATLLFYIALTLLVDVISGQVRQTMP